MDKRRASVFASAGVAGALLVGGAALFANAAGEQPAEPASQIQVADIQSSTVAATTTVEVTTTTIVPVEAPPAPAPVQPAPQVADAPAEPADTGTSTAEPPAPATWETTPLAQLPPPADPPPCWDHNDPVTGQPVYVPCDEWGQ